MSLAAVRSKQFPGLRHAGLLAAIGGIALLCGMPLRAMSAESNVVLGREWPKDQRVSFDKIGHGVWNELVKRYVDRQGNVDYTAWSGSEGDKRSLDQYVESLSRGEPEVPAARGSRLAFWINAYNAVVVRALLNQPVSEGQQRALPEQVWTKWLLQVGAKRYSLDQIENDQLRSLRDPRIHFAIVCGAKGCPRLRDEAYSADRLESQLSGNSQDFFSDPTKLKFDPATNRLKLSPILKWYADDFGADPAGRLTSIAPYLPEMVRGKLKKAEPAIDYLDYDTRLNEEVPPKPASPK